jgi:hypothetical protein
VDPIFSDDAKSPSHSRRNIRLSELGHSEVWAEVVRAEDVGPIRVSVGTLERQKKPSVTPSFYKLRLDGALLRQRSRVRAPSSPPYIPKDLRNVWTYSDNHIWGHHWVSRANSPQPSQIRWYPQTLNNNDRVRNHSSHRSLDGKHDFINGGIYQRHRSPPKAKFCCTSLQGK